MQIRVKLFAAAREALQSSEVNLDVPESATTRDLFFEHLPTAFPPLVPILETAALARNQEYCDLDSPTPIAPSDELAVIPPISGG